MPNPTRLVTDTTLHKERSGRRASGGVTVGPTESERVVAVSFKTLRFGFVLISLVFGIDKFAGFLTDWDQYAAPWVFHVMTGAHFMQLLGAVEILIGVTVAFNARVGGRILAAYYGFFVLNLLTVPGYFDVAGVYFVLSLSALVLSRLAEERGPFPSG